MPLNSIVERLANPPCTARRAMKLKIGEEERSAYDVSRQMTRETRSLPKPKTGAIASWINAQLSL